MFFMVEYINRNLFLKLISPKCRSNCFERGVSMVYSFYHITDVHYYSKRNFKCDWRTFPQPNTQICILKSEEAFKKALAENPDSVQAILAGENGVLTQMENTVEMALKASVGFFDVKQGTLDSDIKKTEEKIKRQEASINTYKTQLEKKFSNMELMIAQMQQNYSSFLGG